MNIVKKLIFDMDGTIADFYSVPNWLLYLENENPKPYQAAKPLVNMQELNQELKRLKKLGWIICITSWLSKNSSKEFKKVVRLTKKEWLLKQGMLFDELHFVQYGTPKQKCTKADVQILLDDNAKVCKSFENAERHRIAINPLEVDIIAYLKKIN